MSARYAGPAPALVVAWSAGAIAGTVALAALVLPLGVPDPSRLPPARVRPVQARITAPAAPLHRPPVKAELIIQQNPMCWVAVPGVTCGPERTYL